MTTIDFPELVRSTSTTRTTYTDQIANHIRAMMQDGRLPPGSYPPSERELARHLRVSRQTVRRAYEAIPGLVSQHGTGWQVAP